MAEDMIERAARAHAREASEWALRVNKAEIEPHEIVRHENPDFVSPVVVESYPNYERATGFSIVEREMAGPVPDDKEGAYVRGLKDAVAIITTEVRNVVRSVEKEKSESASS